MPIDVDTQDSPGYWMARLVKKLQARQPRLQKLDERYRGDAPLPEGAENMRDAYRRFQRKARTNFAELIVEAPRERMTPAGFTTAVAGDENGDAECQRIWAANSLDVEFADVAESMFSMGDAYMIVGPGDDDTPIITGEDPRQVVTIHDPVQQRLVRAGLKLFHDPESERDLAYLYLPGEVHVAYRDAVRRRPGKISFTPKSWTWDDELAGELDHGRVPVVRFRNRRGVGQFEQHVDLLDRIDHMILSRMVIAAFQAYRQRAMKGAPLLDEQGKEIDYNGIFTSDPGAMWDLPEGVELWESETTDFSPILTSVKADVEHLAAVTRVPLAQLMPSAIPQSAEGASLAREGLTFMVEDRIKRATEALRDMMHLAFLTIGDQQRADRSKIDVLWVPPERRSLSERADAASKATDIPWRTRMLTIWGYTPSEVDRMEIERAADAMINADLGGPAPAPGQPATVGISSEEMREKLEALGIAVRAGATTDSAAKVLGLEGLEFTGAVPTSLRLPEADAAGLEAAGAP